MVSNVELIVGGTGAGKTREIVSRLARFYEANPFGEALALAPTIRHGDQLRKRLMAERSVALNLRVETIAAFSRNVLLREPVLSRSTADDLLARVARRTVSSGGAAYFTPIAETGGFFTLISDAIGSLMEEEIEPGAFGRAAAGSDSPRLQALAAIYAAYVADMSERGLIHPLRVPIRAAQAVAHAAPIPNVIMADGFQKFSSSELTLLTALAARTDLTVTMDPNSADRAGYDYERLLSRLPNAAVTNLSRADEQAESGHLQGRSGGPGATDQGNGAADQETTGRRCGAATVRLCHHIPTGHAAPEPDSQRIRGI